MKFRKRLMIQRLTFEGRAAEITPNIYSIMENFDGQDVFAPRWRRQLCDVPVMLCIGKDGRGDYVYEGDCE